MIPSFETLPRIHIFLDTALIDTVRALSPERVIAGFTTNPTLMQSAGITSYRAFADAMLECASGRHVSFEVVGRNDPEILREAEILASLGPNVFVKIPVMNVDGGYNTGTISRLSERGINVNVTAIHRAEDAKVVLDECNLAGQIVFSVFAGRIADTGRDPKNIVCAIKGEINDDAKLKLLWASSREILNVVQAQECGCDIITLSPDLLNKLSSLGKSLEESTMETVSMFAASANLIPRID